MLPCIVFALFSGLSKTLPAKCVWLLKEFSALNHFRVVAFGNVDTFT